MMEETQIFNYLISTKIRRLSISVLVFLAIFHIPLIWLGNDAIGLFDIGIVSAYLLLFVLSVYGNKIEISNIWKEYFLIALLYTGYLLFSLLINPVRGVKASLLVVKFIEHTLFFLLIVIYFENTKKDIYITVRIVYVFLFLMVMYQLYHYFTRTPAVSFDKPWLRIGLPYMFGTSSNPAGFILGVSVILYLSVFFKYLKRKLITTITFILTIIALIFTISRTNVFAIIIVLLIYLLTNIIRDKKALFIIALIVLISFVGFTILSHYFASRIGKINTFIEILRNPTIILRESSFLVRYTIAWPLAYKQWTTNLRTFLIGNGIGYNSVVDGTFIRLMANQGILGFIFFIYLWIIFFLQRFGRYKWVKIVLLFITINGITADTLIVSFRTIQIYLVLILTMVYSFEYMEKHDWKKMK